MSDYNVNKNLFLRQAGLGNVKSSYFKNHCSNLSMTHYLKGGSLFGEDRIRAIDTDPSGRYLVVGTGKGCLSLIDTRKYDFDLSDKDKVFAFDRPKLRPNSTLITSSIETVKWFPHNKVLFVSGGVDKKITIWDSTKFQPLELFIFFSVVHYLSLSKAGGVAHSLIAVALQEDNIKVVDIKSGQFIHELPGLPGGSVSCAWSPTTDYLLAAGGYDHKVKLWDIRSSRSCLAELNVMKDNVTSNSRSSSLVNGVIFKQNGHELLVSCNSIISCWNTDSLQNVYFKPERVLTKKRRSLNFQVGACGGYEACFIPSYNSVVIINTNTGETISRLSGHFSACNCVDINQRTLNVYSGGDDSNIILWSSVASKDE